MSVPSPASAEGCHDAPDVMVRQAVARMVAGSGLEVREMAGGLALTNPQNFEKGQLYIAYENAYVSWERPCWDYYGPLEGFGDGSEPEVTADLIRHIMTGPDASYRPAAGSRPASQITGPMYWTAREVARLLRVTKTCVYRLVHTGELPAVRVGSIYRIPHASVAAYLSQATAGDAAQTPADPGP